MESLEQLQARHRKELKDLQGRITSKKKNATKKTRKGVNDECAELERQLRERQDAETRALNGSDGEEEEAAEFEAEDKTEENTDGNTEQQHSQKEAEEQQQQQPGKKRNRQKERLARRAAEQEAAADQAAAEAATMTDHRSVEAAHMARELAAHGLVEREIAPDGHCLFSAVADQLGALGIPLDGDDRTAAYRVVRHKAAGYIAGHEDDFAPFVEEPLGEYVRKMRDGAEWGGHMELLALASTYGVEIRVVADGRTAVVMPKGREGGDEGEELKRLWLAYYRHGYGLGEHYNSLRRKE